MSVSQLRTGQIIIITAIDPVKTSYSALIFVIREHDFQFIFLNKIYKAS